MQQGKRYEKDSETGAILHRAVDILMVKHGLAPRDVIQAMGVEHRTEFYRIFQRLTGPTEDEVQQLADVFGVTPEEVWAEAE